MMNRQTRRIRHHIQLKLLMLSERPSAIDEPIAILNVDRKNEDFNIILLTKD